MTSNGIVHLVDDDEALRRAVARLLRSAGFETVAYETAQAVLNAAPNLSSGCMLLDLRMPGMDGLELLARMGEFGIDLPVIVLTGHGDVPTAVQAMKAGAVTAYNDENAREQALRAGAVGYLVKPFEEADLLTGINLALQR